MAETYSRRPMNAYVDGLIERLDLVAYVRGFNEPGGGKISTFSDFNVAVDMMLKKGAPQAYDTARAGAPGSTEEFDEAVRARLDPVIVSSFLTAVLEEARIWAVELASSRPDDHDARAPFVDDTAWIEWVMANVEGPDMICGPYGEPVIEQEALDRVLIQALRAERASATRNGWLQGPSIIRFDKGRNVPA